MKTVVSRFSNANRNQFLTQSTEGSKVLTISVNSPSGGVVEKSLNFKLRNED